MHMFKKQEVSQEWVCLITIYCPTLERNHMHVVNETRHSLEIVNLLAIWWATLGRMDMDEMSVAKFFH